MNNQLEDLAPQAQLEDLAQQAQELQKRMQEMQAKLEAAEVEGVSREGLVKVVLNGSGVFLAGTYVLLASRAVARGVAGAVVGVDAGSILRMPRRN